MQTLASAPRRGDGHLWMTALALALLLNLGLVIAFGLVALETAALRKKMAAVASPENRVATILLQPVEARPATPKPADQEKRFARTSDDQMAPAPEHAEFIGERSTRATSDRAPDATAPPLPSQTGVDPKEGQEIETTESDYQDGSLTGGKATPAIAETVAAPPVPARSPLTPETAASEPSVIPGTDTERAIPPTRDALLDGPNPVDVPVPRETSAADQVKPTPEKRTASTLPAPPTPPDTPKPTVTQPPGSPNDPAFRGFQRKTAVVGSISRNGRSALNVDKTALGRYQAAISRAVELEWQRNCVRHRDFITPGFLTVRFFVEPSGRVRSVQFVGDMETGEVQKGFTLNSIRDAEIPAMPGDLRKEFDNEPLELVFRFYF